MELRTFTHRMEAHKGLMSYLMGDRSDKKTILLTHGELDTWFHSVLHLEQYQRAIRKVELRPREIADEANPQKTAESPGYLLLQYGGKNYVAVMHEHDDHVHLHVQLSGSDYDPDSPTVTQRDLEELEQGMVEYRERVNPYDHFNPLVLTKELKEQPVTQEPVNEKHGQELDKDKDYIQRELEQDAAEHKAVEEIIREMEEEEIARELSQLREEAQEHDQEIER